MINSFLHDNAPFIAYLAFLLTIANFVYVFLKDKENTRRWDSINLARLVIKTVRLDTWREIPRELHSTMDWGYDDAFVVIPIDDSGVMRANTFNAAASVIAVNEDRSTIVGTNAITLNELISQLRQLNVDLTNAHYMILYRIAFEILNAGATAASEFTVKQRCPAISDIDILSDKMPRSPQTLQPGESTWLTTNLKLELSERFSDQMQFDILLSFVDVNHNKHQLTQSYIFERATASFRRT